VSRAVSRFEIQPGLGRLEIWDLPTDAGFLERILRDLFENHWHEIIFGPLIEGAAWELSVDRAPRHISLLDGYLTVDLGRMHFHLCIGETCGNPDAPTPPALAKRRRNAETVLLRRMNRDGTPDTWALRMRNGAGEEQMTILFPNPFLTEKMQFADPPDWSKLALWDRVRDRYLGLAPDPIDRSGTRLMHA
jgi:hypothetical protein